MISLRFSKCLKTTFELTFTTQKANACSPWTACSVFNWKNLVQKLKIISLSWNFVPKLIQICRIPWWCSLFFCFRLEVPFWANLVQKIEIVSLSWNLVPRLIWISRIQWWCSLFLFLTRKTFFGQISSKKSKLSVKAEIWYQETNLNKRNSMMFTFSVFDHKFFSWANLVQKIAIVSLSWKLVLKTNSSMKNSIVMFIFLCFRPEVYFFWKFAPKIKIVCWSSTLESRLI